MHPGSHQVGKERYRPAPVGLQRNRSGIRQHPVHLAINGSRAAGGTPVHHGRFHPLVLGEQTCVFRLVDRQQGKIVGEHLPMARPEVQTHSGKSEVALRVQASARSRCHVQHAVFLPVGGYAGMGVLAGLGHLYQINPRFQKRVRARERQESGSIIGTVILRGEQLVIYCLGFFIPTVERKPLQAVLPVSEPYGERSQGVSLHKRVQDPERNGVVLATYVRSPRIIQQIHRQSVESQHRIRNRQAVIPEIVLHVLVFLPFDIDPQGDFSLVTCRQAREDSLGSDHFPPVSRDCYRIARSKHIVRSVHQIGRHNGIDTFRAFVPYRGMESMSRIGLVHRRDMRQVGFNPGHGHIVVMHGFHAHELEAQGESPHADRVAAIHRNVGRKHGIGNDGKAHRIRFLQIQEKFIIHDGVLARASHRVLVYFRPRFIVHHPVMIQHPDGKRIQVHQSRRDISHHTIPAHTRLVIEPDTVTARFQDHARSPQRSTEIQGSHDRNKAAQRIVSPIIGNHGHEIALAGMECHRRDIQLISGLGHRNRPRHTFGKCRIAVLQSLLRLQCPHAEQEANASKKILFHLVLLLFWLSIGLTNILCQRTITRKVSILPSSKRKRNRYIPDSHADTSSSLTPAGKT